MTSMALMASMAGFTGCTYPTDLTLVIAGPNQVAIRWSIVPPGTAITGYGILRDGAVVGRADSETTNYVDRNLHPGTPYAYSVEAFDGTQVVKTSSSLATRTAPRGTSVNGCGTVPPGNHVLTADLPAPSSGACLQIGSLTSIDCQGHALPSIDVSSAVGFMVSNCNSVMLSQISNSSLGVFDDNTLISGGTTHQSGFYVTNGANLIIRGNTFSDSPGYEGQTSDSYIGLNTLTLNSDTSEGGAMTSWSGSNNVIDGNIVTNTPDGYIYGYARRDGFDDGIVLDGETGDTVSNNSIANVWDCGIETTGPISGTSIIDNTITHAWECGIGAWWGVSWNHVTVAGNQIVSPAQSMFQFFNNAPASPVDFENNAFTNNVIQDPPGITSASQFMLGSTTSLIARNNVFTQNDFGTSVFPLNFVPVTLAVDGGGNKCSGSNVLRCS